VTQDRCCRVLLPHLSPVAIDPIARADEGVVIEAHPRARGSHCHRCRRVSTRVHSRYRRHLVDLPVSGRQVTLWLTVRRFFCDNVDCAVRTFVEQVPGLTEHHAQRSVGLRAALVAVGLALAGRAGSRLAATLGRRVSRSTLLRLIRGLPDPPVGVVTVLGVDEFALRRRHDYGTVLVDLAGGNRPLDVLTGRGAAELADWLRAHPGVKMICRDRAGAYADGARDGAPDAIQVADRWHLWDNLCQHVERLVAAHHACLPEPVISAPSNQDPSEMVDQMVAPLWPETTRTSHTRQRYDQTHELRKHGLSMRAIAGKLDRNFKTVRRYLRADTVESLLVGGVQTSVLDPFKEYLHDRLADGERNVSALLIEINGRGYTGGYSTLARYLRPLRRVEPPAVTAMSLHAGHRRCGR
jgi:transposase